MMGTLTGNVDRNNIGTTEGHAQYAPHRRGDTADNIIHTADKGSETGLSTRKYDKNSKDGVGGNSAKRGRSSVLVTPTGKGHQTSNRLTTVMVLLPG